MNTIEIKKSTVAAYRGVGKDVDFMAEKFGITTKEMNEVLVGFGMKAVRSKKVVEPTYIIKPVDDMSEDNTIIRSINSETLAHA
jgi:hypothetical protein